MKSWRQNKKRVHRGVKNIIISLSFQCYDNRGVVRRCGVVLPCGATVYKPCEEGWPRAAPGSCSEGFAESSARLAFGTLNEYK